MISSEEESISLHMQRWHNRTVDREGSFNFLMSALSVWFLAASYYGMRLIYPTLFTRIRNMWAFWMQILFWRHVLTNIVTCHFISEILQMKMLCMWSQEKLRQWTNSANANPTRDKNFQLKNCSKQDLWSEVGRNGTNGCSLQTFSLYRSDGTFGEDWLLSWRPLMTIVRRGDLTACECEPKTAVGASSVRTWWPSWADAMRVPSGHSTTAASQRRFEKTIYRFKMVQRSSSPSCYSWVFPVASNIRKKAPGKVRALRSQVVLQN